MKIMTYKSITLGAIHKGCPPKMEIFKPPLPPLSGVVRNKNTPPPRTSDQFSGKRYIMITFLIFRIFTTKNLISVVKSSRKLLKIVINCTNNWKKSMKMENKQQQKISMRTSARAWTPPPLVRFCPQFATPPPSRRTSFVNGPLGIVATFISKTSLKRLETKL